MRWSRSARPIAALVGAGLLVAARFAERFGGGERGWFADGRGFRRSWRRGWRAVCSGVDSGRVEVGGGGGSLRLVLNS
jgi:hypothetical protein